ncbi:MAG: PKD domain-containing protein [Sphingobacteriaceae bacterium]|nr:MAG: PKD domain-containing protein [Sphingobacteriaceae bacterium]
MPLLLAILFCHAKLAAQTCATVSFSMSGKTGCSPYVVKFTAKGAPVGSTYSWDFGSGSVSGADTIYKAFTVPGKYTITMKVTMPSGTVCTITKKDSVTVLPTPAPNIKVTPGKLNCNGPLEVKFADSTANIVSREWIVDGVNYGDVKSFTHKFTSTGFKSISLKVTNSVGCVGLLSENKFIQIEDTIPTEFCGDIIVSNTDIQASLTPNITLPSGRTIKSYEWSFPGGTPSSYNGKTPPTVKYKLTNIPQDVKLVITTAEGCKYTCLRRNYIQKYVVPNLDSICMGKTLSLSNKANNSTRSFFEWELIGGNIKGLPDASGISVAYDNAGKFSMNLKFRYSLNGCKTTVKTVDYVNVLGPKVEFDSPDFAVCDPNKKINLVNKTNIFGASNVTYTWRLYDSLKKPIPGKVVGPTKTADASFLIKQFGRFGVSLTAKSSNGCTDSVFKDKYITIANPKIASIETDTPSYCLGQTVTLYGTTNPADDNGDSYKYTWTTEHATIPNVVYPVMGSKATWVPYLPGQYNITLAIENGTGCGDTVVKKKFIKIVGGLATIALDEVNGCAGMGTRAVAKVSQKYPNTPDNILKYKWIVDPEDGVNVINDESQIAYIQFWESGTFSILLNVIDMEGCTTQVVEEDLVHVGVSSGFDMPRNKCLGDTLGVPIYASIDAETYKWELTPSDGGVIFPSDTVRDVKLIYNKDTCFSLRLITTKTVGGNVCRDTTTNKWCVNLPEATFTTNDTALYCAPAVASFEAKALFTKKYLWEFGDKTSVFNESPKVSHVYLTNKQSGFDVKLTAFDSNGCSSQTIIKSNLVKIIGPEPKFALDKNIGCDNTFIKFTNESKNIKNFILIYDDGTSLDSNQIEDHLYQIDDPSKDSMSFFPILLATDNTNCKSFFKDTVTIYRSPIASFYSDTLNACVPYRATFKNTSLRAKKWWWDFDNDGIVDDSVETPVYTFTKPGTYTVKLKVKNNGGCYDSIIMNNYINVDPIPEAKFTTSSHAFCGAKDVVFTDSSKYYAYYIFDYGDGSPLETSAMPVHKYLFREGIDQGDSVVYYPKMVVYNSAGCTDTFTDSVIIYANPVSGYTQSILSGCAPLTVEFTDTSKHSFLTEWDFENDGKTDATGTKVTHTFSPGLYTVKQKNTSGFGCMDSAIKVNLLKVNEPPRADFALSDTIICYGKTVQFTDISTPKANLVQWSWSFDEPVIKADTSNLQNPSFTFYTAGYHKIKLKVWDDEGCYDSIIKKALFVEDTLPPVNSRIQFVSVNADGTVQVSWNKNAVYDFAEYRLERSGDINTLINNPKHFSDTLYMDNDVALQTSAKSYCYTISTVDACQNLSLPSDKHCTILLQTVTQGSGQTRLTWNSYRGWSIVKAYNIYRAGADRNYVQIATVAANILMYNDSNLCDEEYCYYVEAAHPNNIYFSRSNISCTRPLYTYQTISPKLQYATVEDNSYVKIGWEDVPEKNTIAYIIDRYTYNKGWENSYALSSGGSYSDYKTKVNEQSYAYRIRTEDACGYLGPYSDPASSIYLNVSTQGDKIVLKWNKYYKWQKGIENYEVQLRKRSGEFVTIAQLTDNDSVYIDDSVYSNVDTAYCYRIVATENSLYPNTSISNRACTFLPPRIYAPNAFTPNSDGVNDVWNVSATSIYNKAGSPLKDYKLQIYDRWGSLVFESNDVYKGWDGKHNGTNSPIGVYVYLIKAEALNGNYINLRGNITLVK